MADLVVQDLDVLADDLDVLITEFEEADGFQDEMKRHWGQLNADLSMGDFADNWKIHRGKMVDAMKTLRDAVRKADQDWTDADVKLAESLEA